MEDFIEVLSNPELEKGVSARLSGGYYNVGLFVPEGKRTLEKSIAYINAKLDLQKLIYGASMVITHKVQIDEYSGQVFVYGYSEDLVDTIVYVLESSLYGDWFVLIESFNIK